MIHEQRATNTNTNSFLLTLTTKVWTSFMLIIDVLMITMPNRGLKTTHFTCVCILLFFLPNWFEIKRKEKKNIAWIIRSHIIHAIFISSSKCIQIYIYIICLLNKMTHLTAPHLSNVTIFIWIFEHKFNSCQHGHRLLFGIRSNLSWI